MQQKFNKKAHCPTSSNKASCTGTTNWSHRYEFSLLGVSQDDVGCDKHEAEGSPQQNEPHPEAVAEGWPVLVDGISAHHRLQVAPGVKDEEGWDNVLDPCTGIGPRDSHQGFQVVCAEGHHDGGHERNEGKYHSVHHPRVGTSVPVEQGLPVVSKRDGDDGEVGADGEDREQAEEVAQHRDV